MSVSKIAYVRTDEAPRMAPPVSETGVIGWVRQNLFDSVGNAIMTVVGIAMLALILPPTINWLFIDAVWTGTSRDACVVEGAGACWAFVYAKFGQFMYGRYPDPERWRVDLTGLLLIAGLVPAAIPRVPFKRETVLYLLIVFPIAGFILLTGGNIELSGTFWIGLAILAAIALAITGLICSNAGIALAAPLKVVAAMFLALAAVFAVVSFDFGLRPVETQLWGGLLVTLVVAIVGIVASFPLGILLALGRRSKLPAVKLVSVIFIEFWRGVPLITVLFMSSVMLPLFLPDGVNFDKLLRALIGVALFASAYMAEVVRGGLQAIPKGQYEAADAMGLSFWQGIGLIIMPQALKLVIPGIVNTFIGLFKDTSLVLIIGLFDLLGIVSLNFSDANWASPNTPATGFVFAAFVFWIFCFGMSRYSIYMERRLHRGHAR
ncbi:amino acid ABC transporter permease [Stappia sp. 28M-7]|jgi:general L-amino acid transport system permease protein|uniref:amino acid ABC transporter permease n=1 Tax=Stappia sp. 28M-7 TaxID=2762596 RepID=UPI000FF37187|nr:amino acid ABC transporter permease [Stappia sp. 28M-7]MBC2859728.1 amino acid ABC transporter permease [Stappia sp. 28M-7]